MKRFWFILLAMLLLLASSCGKKKENPFPDEGEELPQWYYVNLFAHQVMSSYYLWNEEIKDGLSAWKATADPVQTVKDIRYKDASGKDIDRWTMVTDDFSSFTGGVAGYNVTNGVEFALYYGDRSHTSVVGVVTYTYADSPASAAGLRRGDIFVRVNGTAMTPDNYVSVVNDGLYGGNSVSLTLSDGRTVTLTPRDMYEEPLNELRILEVEGRKVGYLHYTSFTLVSTASLPECFQSFSEAGIRDLVLDLRYNGGGYVTACDVLGSLIAPREEVRAGSVFSREIYNKILTEAWEEEPSCFLQEYTYAEDGRVFDLLGANPGIERLYVLVGSNTASASESLICGLKPYMDVTVIGTRTYGKYCSGLMMGAPRWYETYRNDLEEGLTDKALPMVDNWGIYVMYARYADRDGVTLSMPDGIVPDVELEDNPADGYQLGDPSETMLSAALDLIAGRKTRLSAGAVSRPTLDPVSDPVRRPGVGILVSEGPWITGSRRLD